MFNTSSNSDDGSFISETCQVEGDMSTTGNLAIAGIIDGNIVSQKLVILDTRTINGNIESINDNNPITFFEITTATAFYLFSINANVQ